MNLWGGTEPTEPLSPWWKVNGVNLVQQREFQRENSCVVPGGNIPQYPPAPLSFPLYIKRLDMFSISSYLGWCLTKDDIDALVLPSLGPGLAVSVFYLPHLLPLEIWGFNKKSSRETRGEDGVPDHHPRWGPAWTARNHQQLCDGGQCIFHPPSTLANTLWREPASHHRIYFYFKLLSLRLFYLIFQLIWKHDPN